MSVPGSTSGVANRRQKRMGPAPFASFEDLSDEVRSRLESPEDKNPAGSVVRLPGIREDATPTPSNTPASVDHPPFIYTGISLVGAATLTPPNAVMPLPSPQAKLGLVPNTPRIDISRASSSSHHDSRDSTPERELFETHDPATAKLGLGFREEGALDLRSSTEELDFQDPQEVKKKGKTRPQSPSCLHDDSHHQRKDSQSSELGLLCISGRTSRLSSIGSQGSGHSRLSNASHLSVISGQSGLSRSPSPHKMLLETSFCGTKPPEGAPATSTEQTGTKMEAEVLEKVLLARKQDPTQAVLAEGISVAEKLPPEKPVRKIEKRVQSVKSDITIKVDEPQSGISNNTPKLPRKFVSKSGVEYIYIPLKGPLPIDKDGEGAATKSTTNPTTKTKVREVKSATIQSKTNQVTTKPKAKSATPSPVTVKKEDQPKYIRIKLKPDYMYNQEEEESSGSTPEFSMQKPDTLNLSRKTSQNLSEIIAIQKEEPPPKVEPGISLSSTPSASPKLPRQTFLKDNIGSKTPSPSLSRKSSFASLFRSKETILSPESPTVPGCRRKNTITGILREASDSLRERSRSRSKSRERDKSATLSTAPSSTESIDSKHKQKSVFSRFKSKKGDNKSKAEHESTSSSEVLPSIEGIAKVEFKFNDSSKKKYYETPLEGDSIRIPLHSPTHYEDRSILQDLKTSSQDSQETVIEVCRNVEAIVESVPKEIESNTTKVHSSKPELTKRQSSTSSENVVFSTKLGSNNEIFSTKLPKDKQKPHAPSNDEKVAPPPKAVTPPQKAATPPSKAPTPPPKAVTPPSKAVTPPPKAVTPTQKPVTPPQKAITPPSVVPKVPENAVESKREPRADPKRSNNRISTISSTAEDDRYSSGSERDSELDFAKSRKDLELKLDLDFLEPERKGLVVQQDSYEDELPYIPTTLPQERSAAVPIVPVKQRSTFEMKTYPIERPRSTTPINPSCLEEYCEEVMGNFNTETVTKTIEKLKISLPKHESMDKPAKSPRKPSNTNWFEFAEKGISTSGRRSSLTQESETPPPLPPKGIQKEWINFEEIPERRKPPKRIQTLPSRGHIDVPDSVLQDNVVYNYVNPEECKCECHEITAREREKREKGSGGNVQEDELPLLEDEQMDDEKAVTEVAVDRLKLDAAIADRRSIVSDSSVDLSTAIEPPEANGVVKLRTPFTSDLGMSSNRSSIISQDEPESPDSGSPNAFPKSLKPY
ncbi:hypothetical protein Zmor_010398 [Zophobas morio]|uniref:Uncharacterized protein n=2 Tax=Zophobas morio TaxID=2755281 RepID=A0AA38MJS3_9CUCU|nr:hypothetical protein Zmor_010398 [Zophobas morio]